VRQAYLDGLLNDDEVPLTAGEPAPDAEVPEITHRTAETGTQVIDLAAMRADLEAGRRG